MTVLRSAQSVSEDLDRQLFEAVLNQTVDLGLARSSLHRV